jgi:phosphoribosylformylglycinamidine synthase
VESALGGDCGVRVELDRVLVSGEHLRDPARLLFCETPSRLLVSISPKDWRRLKKIMQGSACALLGEVTADGLLSVQQGGTELASLALEEARRAWKGDGGE